MRHARKGPYARKAVALLLALVMMLTLPILAHATNDVPEGAVRIMPWEGQEQLLQWRQEAGFDILDVTDQRVIQDMNEVRAWNFYSDIQNLYNDLQLFGEWRVDSIVVFYVDAPGIIVPVNHTHAWALPFFGADINAQIHENIIRTFGACGDCNFCDEGLDCDFPPYTIISGHFAFSDAGAYLFRVDGEPLFVLVVEDADDPVPYQQPEPQPEPSKDTSEDFPNATLAKPSSETTPELASGSEAAESSRDLEQSPEVSSGSEEVSDSTPEPEEIPA